MKAESIADDPDMQNATAALIRAGKLARKIAQQTETAIVVVRDGQLVREAPYTVTAEQAEKNPPLNE